ncbi:tRNA-uridine aminocarboxypropyltransferase [Vibrio sp. TH_r3]|uniref:tRNA-uridine aminocarboxypropyltransferase n=1 Tax=Vibrio sp. TH_r3 TaxID=3082084 RepID=UPI002953E33E|nr:tRNA-uridine aminocarboxypropyltransferase [Vibrio sp. TH_r3]MDV7104334.1 tRNA-uridine aminocarboxypropyltransferase [Vibrio sp. TH_r3]
MRIHSVHKLIQYRLSISTKQFNARGCKVVRCQYCQIEQQYCICDYQPNMDSSLSALILMSPSEVLKPSNTGRLIADVIKDTHVFQWHRTEPDNALLKLLESPSYCPVIVFPQQYVTEPERIIRPLELEQLTLNKTSDDCLTKNKRLLFVFIDSNWREAKKIFRKSSYLSGLPVLSILPDKVSEYVMRKSDNEHHLSTAEVASLVMEIAGDREAAKTLQAWFELFRESYLLSKTRMLRDLTRPALKNYLKGL